MTLDDLEQQFLLPTAVRVGLVLSGGGAKGAYQAGVVRCLSESKVRVSAVAGASIGALNGAVTASAPSLTAAATRLETIWRELADVTPDDVEGTPGLPPSVLGFYLSLLIAFGQQSLLERFLVAMTLASGQQVTSHSLQTTPIARAILHGLGVEPSIVTDPRVDAILDDNIDDSSLSKGLPLYVSLFRSRGMLADLGWALTGALGIADTPESEFLHVQELPSSQRRQAILASAAIPMIFEAQQVSGVAYADGGLGGWLRVQGNTPIVPLLERSNCHVVIVTHLLEGSMFDRHAFPEATIIEIRPGSPITRAGGLRDTLELDSGRITSWIEQGYEDTRKHLSLVAEACEIVASGRTARLVRNAALRRMKTDDDH